MKDEAEIFSSFKKNVSLAPYTSFRIGGKAEYFFTAFKKEDAISAISFVKKTKKPFFILGFGSNLLVSDKGFKGLVIKIGFKDIRTKGLKITAEAGAPLGLLMLKAQESGLSGLEWLSGIPGTLGGAIRGNAGSFKKSMEDVVKKAEVLDARTGRIRFFSNKECGFGYRKSVFKKNNNLVILSAELELKKKERKRIKEEMKKYFETKQQTQPLNFPSAGSVFKNPGKKSAGELIELCGLKGKRIGGAEISEKHANFIVNKKNAKAKDVLSLINLAKKKVKSKFKINLEEEIVLLGFKNKKKY
jgi:UDP-N-acetylmuramate dehydrogenase